MLVYQRVIVPMKIAPTWLFSPMFHGIRRSLGCESICQSQPQARTVTIPRVLGSLTARKRMEKTVQKNAKPLQPPNRKMVAAVPNVSSGGEKEPGPRLWQTHLLENSHGLHGFRNHFGTQIMDSWLEMTNFDGCFKVISLYLSFSDPHGQSAVWSLKDANPPLQKKQARRTGTASKKGSPDLFHTRVKSQWWTF